NDGLHVCAPDGPGDTAPDGPRNIWAWKYMGAARRGQMAGSRLSNHRSISASWSNTPVAGISAAATQGQMRQLARREISAVSSMRFRSLAEGTRQPSGATDRS